VDFRSEGCQNRRGRAPTYKLDGSVIIADAIRDSSYALERIELLLASLEKRRDVVLHRIYDFRRELSNVLRKASDRLIESSAVESSGVESAAVESAVVALPRRASGKKGRRRQRSDGTVVKLASTAAKAADDAGNDGASDAKDSDDGAGDRAPARKGSAA
jgi:hypothetical protein